MELTAAFYLIKIQTAVTDLDRASLPQTSEPKLKNPFATHLLVKLDACRLFPKLCDPGHLCLVWIYEASLPALVRDMWWQLLREATI